MSSSKRISRDAIIEDLLQDLESGTSRNVFGLPRSGKTNIAKSIRESFEKSGNSKSHRKVIWVDTPHSYIEFWKQMLSQFGVDMVTGADARKCFADEISAFLRRTKDGHVLVEVDDFHRIEEYGVEGRMLLADFKWLLDNLASELGFSCLFLSRKPFRYIQPGDKDNDELADVVADYGIGVFSPEEVAELAGDRKLGEIIYNRTGGFPELADIMCDRARYLKLNSCKLDEIEDAVKSKIHNFFVGLKAQLLKITICGTNLFEALVERECNQAYRIPFEVAEAIRNTGLGVHRLPESMSLLADFIQREHGQGLAVEGGMTNQPRIRVKLSGKMLDVCGETIALDGNGMFLVAVLSLNGFGKNDRPKFWKKRIKAIQDVLNDPGIKKTARWAVVLDGYNIHEIFRSLRDKVDPVLRQHCDDKCQMLPFTPNNTSKKFHQASEYSSANVNEFFQVDWDFEEVISESLCCGKLPKELECLLG